MILLRKMDLTDVDEVLRWENNPENWHFSDTDSPYTREDIVQLVDDLNMDSSLQQRFIICETDTDRRLGALDLFEIDVYSREASVGILIADKSSRRKGFAYRALQLLESESDPYSVEKLKASVHKWNEASLELFKKAGYEVVSHTDELVKFEKCLKR